MQQFGRRQRFARRTKRARDFSSPFDRCKTSFCHLAYMHIIIYKTFSVQTYYYLHRFDRFLNHINNLRKHILKNRHFFSINVTEPNYPLSFYQLNTTKISRNFFLKYLCSSVRGRAYIPF